ncbi:MAG: hypothetical protein H7A32_00095 [Deltaproteobacteria bacterium]|nr:hypothetical protein [Deltaproteobacteria bacterium]
MGDVNKIEFSYQDGVMTYDKLKSGKEKHLQQISRASKLVPSLSRERLYTLLNENSSAGITAVVAPAGYGKTTLLTQYFELLEANGQTCLWLSLEEGDNHITSFLMRLFRVCQEQHAELGKEALQALSIGPMSNFRPYLSSFLEDISQLNKNLDIFLDDLHLIQDKQVLDSILFLLKNNPDNLTIIFSSRMKPPLPLSTLKLSGQLKFISAKELSFNFEETQHFLKQMNQKLLENPKLEKLMESTEGWPAALQMLAFCQETIPDEIFLKGRKEIWSYLSQELISQLDSQELEFLLKTCHLDQLHKDLCNQVCQISNSQEFLENFQKKGLFIVVLDRQRQWFRLHTLFREFLIELSKKRYPQIEKQVFCTASQWYISMEDKENGIQYALKAKEFELVCQLLEDLVFYWIHYLGDYSKWFKTAQKLPKKYQQRPVIQLHRILALSMNRNFTAAEKELKKVSTASFTQASNLQAIHEALQIILAGLKDEVDFCLREIPRWLQKWKNQDIIWQARVIATLGDAYMLKPQVPESLEWMSEALEFAYEMASPHGITWLSMILSNIYEQEGKIEKSAVLLKRALDYLNEVPGSQIVAIPTLSLYLANIHWKQGQVLAAQNLLKKALRLKTSDHSYIETQIKTYCLLSLVGQLEKNWIQAEKILLEGEKLAEENILVENIFPRLKISLMAERSQLYFKSGLEKKAYETLEELQKNFLQNPKYVYMKTYMQSHYQGVLKFTKKSNIAKVENTTLHEKLTQREKEVLEMMQSTMARDEIAQYLGVSLNTLKQHLKSLYGKFGVNSRYALIQKSQKLS